MITGAHILLYSTDPAADRAFLRDVLGFAGVDVGGGWLISALPPAEVAVHPADGAVSPVHAGQTLLGAVLYLMCDDLQGIIRRLAQHGVRCPEPGTEPWGIRTTIPLPSGGALGLYQPSHPTALDLPPPSGPA